MKLFSSIDTKSDISLNSGQKIIPSSTVDELLDLDNLKNNMMEQVSSYKQEVLNKIKLDRAKAEKEGFFQGALQWAEQLKNLEVETEKAKHDAESMIVSLAMEAAKKIVGKQLEIEPSTLIDMIGNSIRPVASHKNITIYVSKKDFSIIYKHKKQVADYFEKLESFAIQEKVDLEPTSCVIETESGIINVHLPTMWAALENAFKKLVENIDIADSSHTQEESS